MKKIIAVLLVTLTVFGLAACGGNSPKTPNTKGDGGNGAAVQGETVNAGDFEVLVPEGWMKYPQTDIFSEDDSVRTDAYAMIKGGKDELDSLSKPTVYVYYYAEDDAETQFEMNKFFYEEPVDLDVTVQGTKCFAFEADSSGYIYQTVFLPASDSSCFQIQIPKDMDGTAGVTIDDADVKAIMESIKVK